MIPHTVRPAAVAGRFYPEEPRALRHAVDEYIHTSEVPPAPDQVTVVVSPHAGYIYSGPTAGHAFARVVGKDCRRAILLGCSHRYRFDTASVFTHGAFQTPLGSFPVDREFAERLAELTGSTSVEPHLEEHALEVQLPFLARAVGFVPIVPVLFGSSASEWHAQIGEALADMMDESDLVVCSTDLSHYLDESTANEMDRHSIELVLAKDWREYVDSVRDGSCSMCGAAAVTAAMCCARKRAVLDWRLLDYRTSAAASGDYNRVVGYAAISMERAA